MKQATLVKIPYKALKAHMSLGPRTIGIFRGVIRIGVAEDMSLVISVEVPEIDGSDTVMAKLEKTPRDGAE